MLGAPAGLDAMIYPYVYFWHRMNRKGQRCAVTARGKMNSCRVQFEDGFVAITSRNAIRKAPATGDQTGAEIRATVALSR